ncbi:TIGR00341 family protein [Qipengyuania aurantiaca]|uniref:TIGR00341 family protein n=1 Tax=Qipengyuania aurantiaca TaxID=2867233 RepID=A0ABX8ZPX0_9SPHN|nr:TIGR00341 family protein [Qipengyuania aurantiaca]QZD91065.1 TIGR00341 family protein [Qipengyuania aurantiaca]
MTATTTADLPADEEAERAARWVFSPVGRAIAPFRRYWRDHVRAGVDHKEVVAKIATECPTTPRYMLMTMMSAGIAILGLLLSSPAVVIGAMLLSPLMSPILGVGFALATGKQKWLKISAKSLALGSVAAVLFSALIVLVSPLQTVTEEIAARTRPNLFDLMVALFSSIAGSYAMIRGREGSIVGVAIATALMPPLAVVGFGLATLNWTVFFGAFGLFFTNFLTIALTATIMARLYGFRTTLSSRQGWFQNVGIFFIFTALAIPLGLSLRQIAWETNSQRIVKNAIQSEFGERARISEQAIDWDSEPLAITATVFTPDFDTSANADITADLKERLGRDVTVRVEQFRVGANPGAAEQAELARARAAEQAAATERQIAAMVSRMVMAAGVERGEVLLDRDTRRVSATARPLPGLSLEGYRELERRVGGDTPGWTVNLRPPAQPLPAISLGEDGPDEAGAAAEVTTTWAARRIGLPLVLRGPEEQTAALATRLRAAGIEIAQVESVDQDRIAIGWASLPQ